MQNCIPGMLLLYLTCHCFTLDLLKLIEATLNRKGGMKIEKQ